MVAMLSSPLRPTHTPLYAPSKPAPHAVPRVWDRSMDDLLLEVRRLFEAPLRADKLFAMSAGLQEQYHQKLQSSNICMLPSYNHVLPTGCEQGTYLALDVGGSTLRIALVDLEGKESRHNGMHIRRISTCVIGDRVRSLRGHAFFDWMADRIKEMLAQEHYEAGMEDAALPMGVAWSFPVEQTSPRSGVLLAMGKGFSATHGVQGQDLGDLIMRACKHKGLNVSMDAIVNDSSATLLSQAYRDPSTRLALILGTGTNAAIHLPVSALSHDKFGSRPQSWHEAANHVLVNTELSMFGKHVLPTTKWDEQLNATHPLPDFQPLEHLVSGRYLGEIVRLILVDAVRSAGLFDGELPQGLDEAYGLDTGTIAVFESDQSATLAAARA
ncbi:N-acetylglucosamine kinase 1, partial [Elasticomyces elasticus]